MTSMNFIIAALFDASLSTSTLKLLLLLFKCTCVHALARGFHLPTYIRIHKHIGAHSRLTSFANSKFGAGKSLGVARMEEAGSTEVSCLGVHMHAARVHSSTAGSPYSQTPALVQRSLGGWRLWR